MYDDDDDIPRRSGGRLGTTIVVSALTSALVTAALVIAGPRLGLQQVLERTEAAGRVRVPLVSTMPPASAREVLAARGLQLKVGDSRPDPLVPAGWIVEQSPVEGTSVARKAEVSVTLSAGPPPIAVPQVRGMHLAEARRAVEAAGLRVGAVEPGGATDTDTVSTTNPPAGAQVSRDTEVRLTVARSAVTADGGVAADGGLPVAALPSAQTDGGSAAAPATEVEVPGLRGKSLRLAREQLEQAGLRLGNRREIYDAGFGPGVVLRQTPAAAARVPRGTPIDVVVNQAD